MSTTLRTLVLNATGAGWRDVNRFLLCVPGLQELCLDANGLRTADIARDLPCCNTLHTLRLEGNYLDVRRDVGYALSTAHQHTHQMPLPPGCICSRAPGPYCSLKE
jgi:hypothetical protein